MLVAQCPGVQFTPLFVIQATQFTQAVFPAVQLRAHEPPHFRALVLSTGHLTEVKLKDRFEHQTPPPPGVGPATQPQHLPAIWSLNPKPYSHEPSSLISSLPSEHASDNLAFSSRPVGDIQSNPCEHRSTCRRGPGRAVPCGKRPGDTRTAPAALPGTAALPARWPPGPPQPCRTADC